MKNKYKNIIYAAAAAVFLARLAGGFLPLANESVIPGGAMNEPFVVVISAVMAGAFVWVLPELLFHVYLKFKKK